MPYDSSGQFDPLGNFDQAGNLTDAGFIATNGGFGNPYALNQNPWDAADTGTVYTDPVSQTTTVTPPGWQAGLGSLLSGLSQTVTTIAPIVNGRPLNAPPGAPQATGAVTTPQALAASAGKSQWLIIVVVLVAVLLFWKRR